MLRTVLASVAAVGLGVTMVFHYYRRKEMAALRREAHELKTQLDNISSRKQYNEEQHAELKSMEIKNRLLWDEVEDLTCRLHHQKSKTKHMENVYQHERDGVYFQYKTALLFKKKMEETALLVAKENNKTQGLKLEHSRIQGQLDKLREEYECLYDSFMFLQGEYDADINAEKENQAILQQKIDKEKMYEQQRQ